MTEVAQFPQELLANELLEAAPDGMVVVDERGMIVLVNREAEKMFGVLRHDLVGQSIEILVPERLRERHALHRMRYRAEPRTRGMGFGLELRAQRADGTDFPAEIGLSPIGADGRTFVIASVRDVTERRLAEEEHRRVLATLDAIHDGVFIFDAKTLRFRYVNQGAVALTGHPREELLTMTPMDFTAEGEDVLRDRFRSALDDAPSALFDMVMRVADGREVPVEVTLQRPPSTGSDQFVAVVRDVRLRREAEEEIRKHREVAATFNERDRIARDLHDLVIQRIFGAGMSLQSALSLPPDARQTDRLMTVVSELDETIREIRTVIFRLQRPVEATSSVRHRVLDVVAESARSLGFEPHLHMDGPIDAAVDEDAAEHLLAVLREALSNCARHAKATRVTVTIEVGDGLALRVVDDGVGLPPEANRRRGRGLGNFAMRAQELGGAADIGPGDHGGTTVEWRVPLQR